VGKAQYRFFADLGDLSVALQHAVARYENYKRNHIAAWQSAKLLAQAREAQNGNERSERLYVFVKKN
jgi:hypothetical protein